MATPEEKARIAAQRAAATEAAQREAARVAAEKADKASLNPQSRLPRISDWSASKEAAANAARAARESELSGRAANVAKAKADGTFSSIRDKFNVAGGPTVMDANGQITGRPTASRLPQLTEAEKASGASVEYGPVAGVPAGTVMVNGVVRPEVPQGTIVAPRPAQSRLPNGLPAASYASSPLATKTADEVQAFFSANPQLADPNFKPPAPNLVGDFSRFPEASMPVGELKQFSGDAFSEFSSPRLPEFASTPQSAPSKSRLPGVPPAFLAAQGPSPATGLSRLPASPETSPVSQAERRIRAVGLDPQSAAAQGVRAEEAKTEVAIAKALEAQAKAREKAAADAQKAKQQALKEAQRVGTEAASRTPSAVSARLSAILAGTA
jgi:hypothetical protein